MKRTILKAVGYSCFFLVAVLLFMYWTFPMEKVRHWAEEQAAEKLKLDVSIGELDLSGLNGIEAADVVIRFRSKKEAEKPAAGATEEATPTATAATGEGDAPAPAAGEAAAGAAAKPQPAWRTVKVDRLEAHVGLWDVLFNKRLDLKADLEALGGTVEGLHVLSDEGYKRWKVSVDKLEGLRLARLPLDQWLGTAFKGRVNGTLSVEIGKDVFTSRGVAELELEGVELPAPELEQTLYGETQTFVLSDVVLGTVRLGLTLDRKGNIPALGAKTTDQATVMHLAQVEVSGGDLDLGLDDRSSITFNKGQGLDGAYLNVHGSFRVAPTFFERQVNDDKPNLFLRTLLQGDRKWRQAERDGVYGFRCVGRPAFKSCTPTAPPVRGRYTPTARKKQAGEEPEGPTAGRAGGADTKGGAARGGIRMLGDREDRAPEEPREGFIRERETPKRPAFDRTRFTPPTGDEGGGLPSLPAPPVLEPAEGTLEPLEEPVEEIPLEEVPIEEGVPVEEGVEEPLPEGEPIEEPLPDEGAGEGGEEVPPEGEPLDEEPLPEGEPY